MAASRGGVDTARTLRAIGPHGAVRRQNAHVFYLQTIFIGSWYIGTIATVKGRGI